MMLFHLSDYAAPGGIFQIFPPSKSLLSTLSSALFNPPPFPSIKQEADTDRDYPKTIVEHLTA